MKIAKTLLLLIPVIGASYFLGPKPTFPTLNNELPALNIGLQSLDSFIAARESAITDLKPDNQARIIWADSVRKTPYSVVYLHGFSSSPMEGDPVHLHFAKKFNANLYLSRLPDHGIKHDDVFADLTPQQMLDEAKEALSIGKMLGEKVILMSTSTGGTLSIYLASTYPEAVFAQILFSPNIELYTKAADLLTGPWGLQLGELIEGKYRHLDHLQGEVRNYWSTTYRIEGVIALKALMEATMRPEVFKKNNQPVFLGYYYKNDEEQDKVVSVEAMQSYFEEISTPADKKVKRAFPEAGHHVICTRFHSKCLPEVKMAVDSFAVHILSMKPE